MSKFAGLLVEDEKTKQLKIKEFISFDEKKGGWVDATGKVVDVPSASPKKTKFFATEAEAKAAGMK